MRKAWRRWTLLTNDIDHEKIHVGQVLEDRYEAGITASPVQRKTIAGDRAARSA